MPKAVYYISFVCALVGFDPAALVAQLECETTNDPGEIVLSYEDVTNFVHSLELMTQSSDTVAILQTEYLNQASAGLREYVRANGYTVEDFLGVLRERPDQFAALRALPGQLASQEVAVRGAFAGLKRVWSDVAFVPVYYFVGAGHAGLHAEPSEYGLLIAMTELADDPSVVRLVLVHETVHVQQALAIGMEEYMQVLGPKMSLLGLALREGTAEFITYLSTGEYAKQEAYEYLIQNEELLWERFALEMDNRLPGDWMFATPSDSGWPPDLGYVVGARIAEAYYAEADDKQQAVRNILSLTDYHRFLEQSRYAERLRER